MRGFGRSPTNDDFPEAPKEKEPVHPPACSSKSACGMLTIAVRGSKGSDVGFMLCMVLGKGGYESALGYRGRVRGEGRKKRFITYFFKWCPFCGKKASAEIDL